MSNFAGQLVRFDAVQAQHLNSLTMRAIKTMKLANNRFSRTGRKNH
jgi:hypothetical protein